MPSFRSASVDGRTVLIPDDPAPGFKNPPLAALNTAYRADDDERRDEAGASVAAASSAMAAALSGRAHARRPVQKPLRPGPVAARA